MSRVFIGSLPPDARESDIERFLREYGRINEISVKRGYGFVEFDDKRDAEDAIFELDGKELLGERVSLQPARGRKRELGYGGGDRYGGGGGYSGRGSFGGRGGPRSGGGKYGPPVRTEFRVTVENLSSRTSWQDLKDYLRQAGKVTYADAHKQRVGEGIVEFASYEDMKNAIRKLHDTDLNGRNIKIIQERAGSYSPKRRSRSRSPRRRSRSRSRSKSPRRRSRSRSRSKSPRRHSRSDSRSKSPKRRSRSRSRSKSPKRRSRSRSHSRSKSRSRSPAKRRAPGSRSRSHSPAKQREAGSRSRSRSPVKQREAGSDRSKSRSRSPSPGKSRSRSKSPAKERSASPEQEN